MLSKNLGPSAKIRVVSNGPGLLGFGRTSCLRRCPLSRTVLERELMLSTWLQVLKFLHAEGVEGCTVRAMDWAAGNGHLETVKWLHEIEQVLALALVDRVGGREARGCASLGMMHGAWSNPVYGPVPCLVYLSLSQGPVC